MWKMPIHPKHYGRTDPAAGEEPLGGIRPLPVFYMSDYSVLGLWVEPHREAVQLLRAHAFQVFGDAEVILEGPSQLQQICRLFEDAGIRWEIADTVRCVYQG